MAPGLIERLIERLIGGDLRAATRAISIIENHEPEADSLLAALRARHSGPFLVGVTGAAGVGKSTLVDRLIHEYRGVGARVGVLAVDPSSALSGGAILGDRVRMQAHALDPGVFIRSMATRGSTGGLARATSGAALALGAAGFDPVLVETIGIGQNDIDVVHVADVVVVVTAPGAGDEVQALKAGVMEIGDIFVVNKADRDGADHAASAIEAMIAMDLRADAPRPIVLRTTATTGEGVAALVEAIGRARDEPRAPLAARTPMHDGRPSRDPSAHVLDHVGVAVADASAFLGFLATAFGLHPGDVIESSHDGVRVRFVDVGGARIEVIEPSREDSAIGAFLRTRGTALHHLAITVADLPEVLASLDARGVRLIDAHPRMGAHGGRIAFVHPASAGGILVELVERKVVRADR